MAGDIRALANVERQERVTKAQARISLNGKKQQSRRHVKSGKRVRLNNERGHSAMVVQIMQCTFSSRYIYSIVPKLSATANLRARSEVSRHKGEGDSLCTSLLLHLLKFNTRCELNERQTALGQITVEDRLSNCQLGQDL